MVTINSAVDHLIDVLAGEDVPVVGSKATRVDQLANMIADGEIVIGGGGDDSVLVVNLTDGEGGTYICDKTCAEIIAAATAGKAILGYYNGGSILFLGGSADYGAYFQRLNMNSDTFATTTFIIAPDDSITDTQTDYNLSSLVIE